MSEKKGVGSKILGIFVESDGTDETPAAGKSPAEVVAELAQSAARKPDPAPPANLRLEKLPTDASGADFEGIFRNAGMDATELDRVKKAEELLRSLPEATPTNVKKQIVEASLRAFGFEVDKIVLAAQNQKRALDAYVKVNENATAKAIQDAELQIRSFNEKIASLKGDIEKRNQNLASLNTAAQKRKGEVQKVIDFFQAPPQP